MNFFKSVLILVDVQASINVSLTAPHLHAKNYTLSKVCFSRDMKVATNHK